MSAAAHRYLHRHGPSAPDGVRGDVNVREIRKFFVGVLFAGATTSSMKDERHAPPTPPDGAGSRKTPTRWSQPAPFERHRGALADPVYLQDPKSFATCCTEQTSPMIVAPATRHRMSWASGFRTRRNASTPASAACRSSVCSFPANPTMRARYSFDPPRWRNWSAQLPAEPDERSEVLAAIHLGKPTVSFRHRRSVPRAARHGAAARDVLAPIEAPSGRYFRRSPLGS